MVRPQQAEKLRQREAIRDRVKFLLDYHWSGNQRQMARDLGVSQGLISKIVNGLQGAGRQFLTVLGQQRGVNPDWLLRGEGQPLSLPPKGTLPIAEAVLPGPPLECSQFLTGQRYPVAETFERPTRYWLELQSGTPLLRDVSLGLLPKDLLLMETDAAWTVRLDLIQDRLCGVRYENGLSGPSYVLGKLYNDSQGVVLDALAFILRLTRLPTPGASSDNSRVKRYVPDPVRRTIRYHLGEDEELHKVRRDKAATPTEEPGREEKTPHALEQPEGGFVLADVLAVAVLLTRPSPGVGRKEAAVEGTPVGGK